ncbi:sensor histidine kinase [Sorangium sp. So ce887]|uniref:sensor histidine kinase n=1 Tax=Sorangium sp. So ce887 TaxID=3133324 RepID=UPI003F6413DA
MLHEFLTANTQTIIARARSKVAVRTTPVPTEDELKNGVPLFLDQIIDRLRLATLDTGVIGESAAVHGGELLAMGFTVSQVIHGYGDVCQVVTQLADETDALITADEFNTFNACLDDAIAGAVTEYERQRDASVAYEGTERLGILAHELRNRLAVAMLAFTMLQAGTVGIGGSTGAMLGRSLRALRDLINNSLAGVRLESGLGQHRRVSVSEIVGQAVVEAALGAGVGGFSLTAPPVTEGIDVRADPQILLAALGNLLQNAFKFSRPSGHISLRTSATAERVLIEVQDQCGGLPPGKSEELFRPFTQRSANRTGLGLGLSICRKGVEAMGGKLGVRDLPGKGCVFSIDLPRLPPATTSTPGSLAREPR